MKILDTAHGILTVRFGERDFDLPLRVETTARGQGQTDLVANFVRNLK